VAGDFPQGTAPNHPEVKSAGIPKKDALNARMMGAKYFSGIIRVMDAVYPGDGATGVCLQGGRSGLRVYMRM
jgi:hypothetical protein